MWRLNYYFNSVFNKSTDTDLYHYSPQIQTFASVFTHIKWNHQMYQMLAFSLMKYQIFPETWVIMSFTTFHTTKKSSACCNVIQKSLKLLSHILEKPREIKKNQEVDDFLILKLKTRSGLYRQSKAWNSPKELRWACLQNPRNTHRLNHILKVHNHMYSLVLSKATGDISTVYLP